MTALVPGCSTLCRGENLGGEISGFRIVVSLKGVIFAVTSSKSTVVVPTAATGLKSRFNC